MPNVNVTFDSDTVFGARDSWLARPEVGSLYLSDRLVASSMLPEQL